MCQPSPYQTLLQFNIINNQLLREIASSLEILIEDIISKPTTMTTLPTAELTPTPEHVIPPSLIADTLIQQPPPCPEPSKPITQPTVPKKKKKKKKKTMRNDQH